VGGTQALFTQNIPSQIQYAALGHLHRYHAVGHDSIPVVYSSSPLAYSFSEAGQEKKVVLIEAEAGKPVSYRPIGLKQGRPLYRVKFDNLADTLAWLEGNPYCYVEITFVTDESIDAATRKAIMKAHDGIVSLIPQLKNTGTQESFALHVDDLGKDMETLFRMYYQSEKGQEPNTQLLGLFKEIISQTDPA
jgi:exonuclease SbcD